MALRKRTQSSRKLLGPETSETRAALISAVEQLLDEEGYAAITARRIARKLGMKHQVVFYYFDTLDDLLLAVFRHTSQRGLDRLGDIMQSDQPLRGLWEYASDPQATRRVMEYMALANHNAAIRAEIARYGAMARKVEVEGIERHLRARGVDPRLSPLLITLVTSAVGRMVAGEISVDIDLGHSELEALVESVLERFERTGQAV